ncbi:hypothetical protein RBI14_19420 [Alcaligenaceae bacterium B3P038]|nr:hypothetical protein [Alcaligenaceae bacterium B3P038]
MQLPRNASFSTPARWALCATAILIAVHLVDILFETLTGPFAQQARTLYAMWSFQRLVGIGMLFNGAVACVVAYALVAHRLAPLRSRHPQAFADHAPDVANTNSPPLWRFALILSVLGLAAHRLTPYLFGGVLETMQSLEGPERLVRIAITGVDMILAALVTALLVQIAVWLAWRPARVAARSQAPLGAAYTGSLYGAMFATLWLTQLRLGWATDLIPESSMALELPLLLLAPLFVGAYARHLATAALVLGGAPHGAGTDAICAEQARPGLRTGATLKAALFGFILAGLAAWILVQALNLAAPLFEWDNVLGLVVMFAALPAAVKLSMRKRLRQTGP